MFSFSACRVFELADDVTFFCRASIFFRARNNVLLACGARAVSTGSVCLVSRKEHQERFAHVKRQDSAVE